MTCPNCERNQDALRMAMEEHAEVAGEQQDRIEGLTKVIKAHLEVQVMHLRGFQFRWEHNGRDVWEKAGEAEVPAHELARVVVMQVADDVDRANRGVRDGS